MASKRCRHRQRNPQRLKRIVSIVCEGERTEPTYFRGLRDCAQVAGRFTVKVRSESNAIEKAIEIAKQGAADGVDYDYVWAVVDAEGRDRQEKIKTLLAKAAKAGVVVCVSNPCFEYWPMLHLERANPALENAAKMIARLNPLWRAKFGCDYDKNDSRIFEKLSPLTETAVANSRALWDGEAYSSLPASPLERNPCTQVHDLVAILRGLEQLPAPNAKNPWGKGATAAVS